MKIETSQNVAVPTTGAWETFSASLRKNAESLILGGAALTFALGLTGCGAVDTVSFGGTAKLPPPPAGAVMEVGGVTETAASGFSQTFVVWDKESESYKLHSIGYRGGTSDFRPHGSVVQEIPDGTVVDGAIVDQKSGCILLSNGFKIDGKNSRILDRESQVVKELK